MHTFFCIESLCSSCSAQIVALVHFDWSEFAVFADLDKRNNAKVRWGGLSGRCGR